MLTDFFGAQHTALHSSPGGLRLCSKCFRPLVHGNRLHPQQVAFCAASLDLHPTPYRSALPGAALRPAGSICTTCRIARRQSTRSSPHSRPAVQFASACIRSQMRLSTCPAPHSSPGGLRLCSKCFRPLVHGNSLHPQQVAFYAASPYRSALPGAALRPSGSICAAMLSLSNAAVRIRAQLFNSHRPAFAVR